MGNVYVTNENDLKAVANAIREKADVSNNLVFPNGFVDAVNGIPEAVPIGMNIKYIIPCSFTAPRTADGLGFGAIPFTFNRENVNQLFFVNWELQDATDNTTPGFWFQHDIWVMCYTGNYGAQHCINRLTCGHGKAGNGLLQRVHNYSKTNLSQTLTWPQEVGADANYAKLGQNYKGLLFITDSTYTGKPIVDETKLSDFLVCDYITQGW